MIALLASLAWSSPALPGPDAAWETLLTSPVRVECTQVGEDPFCRSTAVFEADAERLYKTLHEMPDHADLFESIVEVNRVGDDALHVVMDFPWPLADRDYVARYSREQRPDGSYVITWVPADAAAAPPADGRVRLDRFTGSWTLVPGPDGTTTVTYMWLALYGGALPSSALTTARKKTGQESLKDLAKAAGGVAWRAP